jgi:hypothetical protein
MSHAILARHAEPTTRTVRRVLFKRDHPRAIDEYISYFGGPAAESTIGDPCGEGLLDCFEEKKEVRTRRSLEVGP